MELIKPEQFNALIDYLGKPGSISGLSMNVEPKDGILLDRNLEGIFGKQYKIHNGMPKKFILDGKSYSEGEELGFDPSLMKKTYGLCYKNAIELDEGKKISALGYIILENGLITDFEELPFVVDHVGKLAINITKVGWVLNDSNLYVYTDCKRVKIQDRDSKLNKEKIIGLLEVLIENDLSYTLHTLDQMDQVDLFNYPTNF